MPAIVLTCDEYRPLTENMIRSYEEFWPSHPFVFHIPFQENSSLPAFVPRKKVKMVPSSKSIKESVLTLLQPFENHEFVYWCIDDKFILSADPKKLDGIFEAFLDGNPDLDGFNMNGLAFTRARGLIGPPNLSNASELFLDWRVFRRTNLNGFWFPQILRVGVLRDFYTRVPQLTLAKEYDYWKKESPIPENLFVTLETLISLAESTHRGKVTARALKAMHRRGISPPLEMVSVNPPKFRRVGFVSGRLSKLFVSVGFFLRRIRVYTRSLKMRNAPTEKP